MAEDVDPESKTEDPTPHRREEARRQGQVPFSAELVGGVVLLAGIIGLGNIGPNVGGTMLDVFRSDLARLYRPDLTADEARELIVGLVSRMLTVLAPMFGILLAIGVAAAVAQVGFSVNTDKLAPNFDKLNPVTGFGRLFSMAAVVRGLQTVAKVSALAIVAYLVIEPRGGVVASLARDRLGGAALTSWALVVRLATYLAAAVAGVAVIDYLYQRRRFEQSLRMSKQEIKDEHKQEEGDPHIKARIRQIARDRFRQRMLKAVPTATVVVTNPTHYAVALRYDADRDAAPVVVARGAGAFARRVAKLARERRVPVVERPVLARALYGLKEGQSIPGPLFRAVAEVLAFVYKLRGVGPGQNPAA
ncbi:MAG TPA: flagellar biosynthesis protein FlhB [Urbifossiella sp.]|nr:flagellar biosynthesis protein FlhB [Urbifossiella sp.]